MTKIALVTGASRGIGQAIADRLGQDGLIVIGTATSEQGADRISERFQQKNIQGQGKRLDVADDHSVNDLIAQIQDQLGPIQILINNAGITRDNLLMRMKADEWHSVINTNLNALYRLCKACIRGMMKSKSGRIINIASVVASMGNAGQTNYAAAKAGMIGFTKSLAQEVGSRGITVNAVAPGFIDTDMTKALAEKNRQNLIARIPLGRLGQAEEVAAVVSFLASESAAYITGETIHVNGGMYMV